MDNLEYNHQPARLNLIRSNTINKCFKLIKNLTKNSINELNRIKLHSKSLDDLAKDL